MSGVSRQGSVLGGVLLISGSSIGAGMLAIPVTTGIAGFFPASVLFFVAWASMTATALLLAEANLACGHRLSLISLANRTLGKKGKVISWILFLFLFYSLGIAYIAASGSILSSIGQDLFGISLPNFVGSFAFTLLFGIVIYFGTRPVDLLNRILMFGLIVTYFVLLYLGSLNMDFSLLKASNWNVSLISLPVLVISFGFHNMIPTLAEYFHGNRQKLRKTILIGSLIPLLIYLLWEAVLLGIIPIEGRGGLLDALSEGETVTTSLRALLGPSWISSMAEGFSLFAITTSFLAQSLSLVDFLADGLKIEKVGKKRVFLVLVTLIPSFVFAFVYPGIFLSALNFAGGFSAVILFGMIPVIMVWKLRNQKQSTPLIYSPKPILTAIFAFALFVFFIEATLELKELL